MIAVALIHVRQRRLRDFRRYERAAARIMRSHGGRIAATVAVAGRPGRAVRLEIHVLSFPSLRAFRAYHGDARLQAVAHLRARSVLASEVLLGRRGPDYHARPAKLPRPRLRG
jgi:uncharacterized protein (DUF1330 family)